MTPEKKAQIEADAEAYLTPYNDAEFAGKYIFSPESLKEAYIAGRTAEADKAAALVEALENILTNPSDSCPMCDSGKLRNPNKGHWSDCKFEIAKQALNNYKKQ